MTRPGEILRRYGIRPDKRRGQSFLTDSNTVRKIAQAAKVKPEDIVVEIGAGFGVLTKQIAPHSGRLIAVEIDVRLVEILKKELAEFKQIEIYREDVLKFDFSCKSKECKAKLKVIGNVPYSISSPVVFHLLAQRSVIRDFTLMLQKEVVERLVSPPGHKSYGVPSVLLQMYAEVERLFDVSADCFYPKPKVESSVICGTFRDKPLFELTDEAFFGRIVKAAFAQRRKMLFNNLKHADVLEKMSPAEIQSTIAEAGIDGKRRGETLSVEEFAKLSNALKNQLTNGR